MTPAVPPEPRTRHFLHLSKAAETTLHTVLARQFRPRETFTLDGSPARERRLRDLPEAERPGLRPVSGHMSYGRGAGIWNRLRRLAPG